MWGAAGDEARQRRHDGNPRLQKQITSELGNVSPWIMVPGAYTPRQLAFQAQRRRFGHQQCVVQLRGHQGAGHVERLAGSPEVSRPARANTPRHATALRLLPGARERFARFAGCARQQQDGTLPWTMLRDVDPDAAPHLLQEESFVCVFAEVALDAASPESFISRAVDFVNEQLFGTLSAR